MKIYSNRNYNSDIPTLDKFIGKDRWVLCNIVQYIDRHWVKIEESTPYDYICFHIPYDFLHIFEIDTEEKLFKFAEGANKISKTSIKIVRPMEICTTEELIATNWV